MVRFAIHRIKNKTLTVFWKEQALIVQPRKWWSRKLFFFILELSKKNSFTNTKPFPLPWMQWSWNNVTLNIIMFCCHCPCIFLLLFTRSSFTTQFDFDISVQSMHISRCGIHIRYKHISIRKFHNIVTQIIFSIFMKHIFYFRYILSKCRKNNNKILLSKLEIEVTNHKNNTCK